MIALHRALSILDILEFWKIWDWNILFGIDELLFKGNRTLKLSHEFLYSYSRSFGEEDATSLNLHAGIYNKNW